jgi:general secretion pathway protein G
MVETTCRRTSDPRVGRSVKEEGMHVARNRWRRSFGRAAARGMTLVEIMIVVIIMALIATGVAFAVIPMLGEARVEQTRTDLRVIQQAATIYMAQNRDQCPSAVNDLVEDGQLSRSARTTDAWGNAFGIQCEPGVEPTAISAGPDGQEGTADDVRTDQVEGEEE